VHPEKLFFIYVAKNEEWEKRQREDWDYVSSMSRFYRWWIKRNFELDVNVEAEILPVVPGKLFDRMSISYLSRDHIERGKSVYHFYLTYFKPFWTDCQTEGYAGENFGMIYWKRLEAPVSDSKRVKFFADMNCAKLSHVLCHEVLRMLGKKRKEYFDSIHDLWERHVYKDLPYIYYNERFRIVLKESSYRYVTIDVKHIH
jgi:hypothetical protein